MVRPNKAHSRQVSYRQPFRAPWSNQSVFLRSRGLQACTSLSTIVPSKNTAAKSTYKPSTKTPLQITHLTDSTLSRVNSSPSLSTFECPTQSTLDARPPQAKTKGEKRVPNLSVASAASQPSASLVQSSHTPTSNAVVIAPNFNAHKSASLAPRPQEQAITRKAPSKPKEAPSAPIHFTRRTAKLAAKNAAKSASRQRNLAKHNAKVTRPEAFEVDLTEDSSKGAKKRLRTSSPETIDSLAPLTESKRACTASAIDTDQEPIAQASKIDDKSTPHSFQAIPIADDATNVSNPDHSSHSTSLDCLTDADAEKSDDSWFAEWDFDPSDADLFDFKCTAIVSRFTADETAAIVMKPLPIGLWMDETWLETFGFDLLFS